MVLFDIELPSAFWANYPFDEILQNGLTRWTWILESHSLLLSYPVNLKFLTLNTAKTIERRISLDMNASLSLGNNMDMILFTIHASTVCIILFCRKY